MSIQISGISIEKLGKIPKDSDKSYQYLLIRFLLGTVEVSRDNIKKSQNIDFSSLPSVTQTNSPAKAVDVYIKSYNFGCSIYSFIKITRADNRLFFKEILSEFLNYQIHTNRENHTSAFIFLYRILERMSFSIPLLYASTESDFYNTFNDLKMALGDEKGGELGFFKKFLNKGKFIDNLKLQILLKISFSNSTVNSGTYTALTEKLFTKFSSIDKSRHEFEIKFAEIPDFLITLRNRFFHTRTGDGKQNITTLEMINSDEYFSSVNPVIANFLGISVLQIIASKYSK